jgi:hypothetical protein
VQKLPLERVRGQVLHAAMRADRVVVAAPVFDHDASFGAGAEPFQAQALVAQLAVEAFRRRRFARACRIDQGGVADDDKGAA